VLSPIIGHNGVAALFYRCVSLRSVDNPWLIAIQTAQGRDSGLPLTELRSALTQQAEPEAATVNRMLLCGFREQLASLIGESLTDRLLRPIWSDICPEQPMQDQTS